jgi:phosphoribosylanthranilate isomerase
MASTAAPTAKICGIRSIEVLQAIAHLPITYIGFVFARSKRQVSPEQAGEMIRFLQKKALTGDHIPLTVGVFVNPGEDELLQTMQIAPLDVVQLHGQETPEFCKWVKEHFGVLVFKAVHLQKSEDRIPAIAAVAEQLNVYRGNIDAVLLDTFDPVYGGGSGNVFAWNCIPPYQEWAREAGVKLLVAGGMQPDNVAQLLADYQPDGVDVSSGVETDGVKDISKITAFVERVIHHGASS